MELRSTRSRSKTPLALSSYQKLTLSTEGEEDQVVKTTRRTTTTTVKSQGSYSSNTFNEDYATNVKNIKPTRTRTRSDRIAQKLLYKTSDYSSEEGDHEVTSSTTSTIDENIKNQMKEEAKAAANGGDQITALGLYRRAKRYWEEYPKTDWTYSRFSKDRVELAPGVVAMPNMSRRTIHSYSTNNKYTSTDFNEDEYDGVKSSYSGGVKPYKLFANNNYEYDTTTTHTKSTSIFRRFFRSIFTLITTVITTVLYTMVSTASYGYYGTNYLFVWLGKKLHRLASKVMLLDTWLLQKNESRGRIRSVLLLCLIPLLLLGGWWLLSSLGGRIYGIYSNTTLSEIFPVPSMPLFSAKTQEDPTIQIQPPNTIHYEEKVITEKIYIEPPSAQQIASSLSKEQLETIAASLKGFVNINQEFNTNDIVYQILHNSEMQSTINDLRQELDKLKIELQRVEKASRLDLLNAETQLRRENSENYARLTFMINRCCRKPMLNIEGYVRRILTGLLSDPAFLNNQKGLVAWLNTMFVAKGHLENHLGNLTQHLDDKFSSMVEHSGQIIMDKVAAKILAEMSATKQRSEVALDDVSDDRIRAIVKNLLAVYDADKTGLVDYAMEPMGGQVLTIRCTESFHSRSAVISIWGIPLWYPTQSPRTVITPGINPGECWAFQNFPGILVIKLAGPVRIDAFSMEHISRLLVPGGKIDSAPKAFEIYGLTGENDVHGIRIGSYVYDYDGDSLQYFAAQEVGHVFEYIEIRILSNHGNPNYTCLYRFRVHGVLQQST